MSRALAASLTLLALHVHAGCDGLFDREVVKVTPHVTLFQSAEGTTGVVNGNTVVIAGRDGLLVLDPGQFPAAAQRTVAALKRMTDAPVKYIVVSHWHGDHHLGTSAFIEAWPEAKIVAHPFTIAEIEKRYGNDYVAKTRTSTAGAVDFYRKKREATDPEEREWIDRTFECVDRMVGELEATRIVIPGTAVAESFDIDLGGVTASIRHLGTGNTPGDLVVWVPADRLLATGDIVVHPSPYALGSDLKPWPATLDRMLALAPAVLVPGHGPPLRDDAYVRDLRALFVDTQRQVESLLAAGVPKAEAAAKLDTRMFRDKRIATAMQRQAFDKFFVQGVVNFAWPR